MKIERIEDKNFMLTLTDDEADMISDESQIDFQRSRVIAIHIGEKLLFYMMEACQFPHARQLSLKVEL